MARRRNFAGNGKKSGAGAEPGQDPKGLKKLSREADKALDEHGNKIAEALVTKAGGGDLDYLEALVNLANRKGQAKRGGKKKSENAALAIVNEIKRNRQQSESRAAAASAGKIGA